MLSVHKFFQSAPEVRRIISSHAAFAHLLNKLLMVEGKYGLHWCVNPHCHQRWHSKKSKLSRIFVCFKLQLLNLTTSFEVPGDGSMVEQLVIARSWI